MKGELEELGEEVDENIEDEYKINSKMGLLCPIYKRF